MPPLKQGLTSPALIALVLANFIPVFGVLFADWSVREVLIAYWLENVAVGVINVIKLLTNRHKDTVLGGQIFMSLFFIVHYGMFTFGHGTFVFSDLTGGPGMDLGIKELKQVLIDHKWLSLGFFGSHLFSYFQNYLIKGESKKLPLNKVMFLPYARIMILHITIVFGGIGVVAMGSPIFLVILLVLLKTGGDIALHLREHRS